MSPVHESVQHLSLHVSGRVQGVGFRPFVCRLAQQLGLEGSVCNDAHGVSIHIQGVTTAIERFESRLCSEAPTQADISTVQREILEPTAFAGFCIAESQSDKPAVTGTQIPADIGLCERCLAEFHDPNNRRYHDPFINCSDCGPRYSILHALPYDRSRSSMREFDLCPACQGEYRDPGSRRFHTQGISCPDCGPRIELFDKKGGPVAEGGEAVGKVAGIIKQGGVVAFKGIGGFHLLCDATHPQAVETLRRRKRRKSKPFAVLCRDLQMAQKLADLTGHEVEWLTSDAKPIVLVRPKAGTELSDRVAPEVGRLGLFLAYTPLQHLLFEHLDRPLVATSANLSGEPILYRADQVLDKLCSPGREVVDYVLDYDREIVNPCDDSLVQSINGKTVTLRLARGLAPFYLPFRSPFKGSVLAVGAQQKSSVALAGGEQLVLSPYIGDLHSLASLQRFERTIERLASFAPCEVSALGCDCHPHYHSTQWAQSHAEQNRVPLLEVQHHHAHVLACMAEFNLRRPVLAFSWDGTGWGDDGTVWGGEVLLADARRYQRALHLKPFKLLGGDLANRQPKRVALSLLFEQFVLEEVLALESPTVQAFSSDQIRQLYQMHQQNLNSPLSSSMGRLFDAVASLLGVVQTLDYEGQGGLLLEALYDRRVFESYSWNLSDEQMDPGPVVERLLSDRKQGASLRGMVSRFFNGLVELVEQVSDRYPHLPVVATGGVWQNQTLLTLLDRRFENRTQTLYFQQDTPMNDAAIALGQLWYREINA